MRGAIKFNSKFNSTLLGMCWHLQELGQLMYFKYRFHSYSEELYS